MPNVFSELNNDQLNGLAQLCFDLAKGSFALIIFPADKRFENPIMEIIKTFVLLITGLAFTYIALVLLKLKENR